MGEHGQADERFDGAEAEGSSHDQAQLLVQALQRSGGEPEPEAAPDHAKSLRLPLRRSAHRPGHARPWRPMPAAPRESHNSVIQPTDHAEDPVLTSGARSSPNSRPRSTGSRRARPSTRAAPTAAAKANVGSNDRSP